MIRFRRFELYILVATFTLLGVIFAILLAFLIPSLTEKLREDTLRLTTEEISAQLGNVERDLKRIAGEDIFSFFSKNRNWRWFFEKRLETLLTRHIENAYLIAKAGEDYVYLLFSNKGDLRVSPLDLNIRYRDSFNRIYSEGKTLLINRSVYISLLKPIVSKNGVIGIFGVDFSPLKFREVERHIFMVKGFLIASTVLLFVLLGLLVFITVRSGIIESRLYTDSLTGVLARNALFPVLSSINLSRYGLILFDIDNFKAINDTYGHEVGDKVLKAIASRLKGALRKDKDYLFRYGGEEFLILARKERSDEDIVRAAERMRRVISSSMVAVNGNALRVTVSLGVHTDPASEKDIEEAIRKADMALYMAKRKGKDRVEVYREKGDLQPVVSLLQVRDAVEEDRLIFHYQPVFNLRTMEIIFFEALARIVLEDGSVLAPGSFLPSVRGTETYKTILKRSIEKNVQVLEYHENLKVSLNVEVSQLLDDDVVGFMEDMLKEKHDLKGRLLIEILEYEGYSTGDRGALYSRLRRLERSGLVFLIDDFGTGYSNLLRIADIPVRYVKIAGEIIENINRRSVKSLCGSVYSFCSDLGIGVIAEHVSSEEILQEILSVGIELGQGFHLGKPEPLEFWLERIRETAL